MNAETAPHPAMPVRALEMHGGRMWERGAVQRVLAFMQSHDLNTLVLHETDLVHQVVYPRTLFDPYALWSDLPSRRGENAIFNRRAYLAHLLKLAQASGVTVWLNVKEIGFSDEVLVHHPQLMKNGVVCPSEPFWNTYVHDKTHELFTDFPLLGGLIVSLGSQESRASRVQNLCRCDLCRGESLQQWYGRFIQVLHDSAAQHGKGLAIRDFAYKPVDHEPLVNAMRDADPAVVFCIKAMPHDFYIGFPDNPALGATERTQWIEYDVMGQFFGWGVMPCLVLDDLAPRLQRWRDAGVQGVILRIEWERINDLDALDTLNEINLIAGASLLRGHAPDAQAACADWLQRHGWDASAATWLAGVMDLTLPVVSAATYLLGHVAADSSMLPRSVQRAWWGMESRDSLGIWAPERAADLQLTPANLQRMLAEKDHALECLNQLMDALRVDPPGVDTALLTEVRRAFAHVALWVRGHVLCARACIYSRLAGSASGLSAAQRQAFSTTLNALERFADEAQCLADNPAIPHQVVMLVDAQRARDVLRESRAVGMASP